MRILLYSDTQQFPAQKEVCMSVFVGKNCWGVTRLWSDNNILWINSCVCHNKWTRNVFLGSRRQWFHVFHYSWDFVAVHQFSLHLFSLSKLLWLLHCLKWFVKWFVICYTLRLTFWWCCHKACLAILLVCFDKSSYCFGATTVMRHETWISVVSILWNIYFVFPILYLEVRMPICWLVITDCVNSGIVTCWSRDILPKCYCHCEYVRVLTKEVCTVQRLLCGFQNNLAVN